MTVAELIAALQEIPGDAVVHGCNRDMVEIQHGRNMYSLTLEFLEYADPTVRRIYLRDIFSSKPAQR